jgi:hypothetical protein
LSKQFLGQVKSLDFGTKLVDDSATEASDGVVDAFRRSDLTKANELRAAFLAAD